MKSKVHSPRRNRRHRVRPVSRGRLALTLICLLTSLLQISIAQAHLHGVAPAARSAAISATMDTSVQQLVAPAASNDEPGNHPLRSGDPGCPLCQAALLSGAMLAPSCTGLLRIELSIVALPPYREPTGSISAVSYSWQGRGPPLV